MLQRDLKKRSSWSRRCGAHLTLEYELSESDLPYKVDRVDWSTLNDNFKQLIQDHHEVIQDYFTSVLNGVGNLGHISSL